MALGGEPKELLRSLVRVTTALRAEGVPFALTGGSAVYALGGPLSLHDVDVLVKEEDTERALAVLAARGMRVERPPEDWLTKVFDGDVMIDLIFRPNDRPVTDEILGRACDVRVGSVTVPVLPATDVLVEKLLVLGPHRCDLAEVLTVARALREQVDWQQVRDETKVSPYAEAFLLLGERLAIVPSGTVTPLRPADWSEGR
ncbi:MAG TPA: nucleotidyltransferase [Pseudonocardiaceae bacterium]